MHIGMPVIAILGGAPVTEQQRRHGHKKDEAHQRPQRRGAPRRAAEMWIRIVKKSLDSG